MSIATSVETKYNTIQESVLAGRIHGSLNSFQTMCSKTPKWVVCECETHGLQPSHETCLQRFFAVVFNDHNDSGKDAIPKTLRSRAVYKFSCAGCSACYVGETNRYIATRVREHLRSDKNSHIFQHTNTSETCKALCSEDRFSILDTASMSSKLKIKEALDIGWEKPLLNK